MAFCCDKLSLYTTNTKKFRVDYYETRERERERERVCQESRVEWKRIS